MKPLILSTIGNAHRRTPPTFERFFEVRPPLLTQILVALFFMLFGLSAMLFVNNITGDYYPSITIATTILVTLFSGFISGVAIAISTELIADYLFTPPIGSILANRADIENFLIVLILSVCMSLLVAALRETIRKTITAKQEAERAAASMEKVLATISHDIRNSLGISALAVDSMQRFFDNPERLRSLIATALAGLDQTDKMINDLLDATRGLERTPISIQFEYCDLCAVVQKAFEGLSFIYGERFRFAKPPQPIMGLWNPTGIRRALENLGSNAVKYGFKERPITITLYRNEDNAMISVHNEGNAIREDDRLKLFDRFYRTKSAEETYSKGWGIGLAVVKEIAEAHGGSVSVESTKETGTTFTIATPIRAELAPNDPRQAA